MGKCFLWLWGGILFGLSFTVSELSWRQVTLARCLSNVLEWTLIGGVLTVAAIFGYALYTLCEQRNRCL